MNNEELKNNITNINGNLEFTEEYSEFLNIIVSKEELHQLCSDLKSNKALSFDYLYCMTGIDYGKALGVIYHLESVKHKHQIVLKVNTEDRKNPVLDSVCDLWKTAEYNEMEIYDFFGIKFANHPNLKRLFLTPDWNGFPLRKDYIDEDNMVIK